MSDLGLVDRFVKFVANQDRKGERVVKSYASGSANSHKIHTGECRRLDYCNVLLRSLMLASYWTIGCTRLHE